MTDTGMDPRRLSFDGTLTVRNVAPLRDALLEALASGQDIEVDCRAADAVDLSFVQLLLAARLSALRGGRRLSLAGPAEGALLHALEQGGFLTGDTPDGFWAGNA